MSKFVEKGLDLRVQQQRRLLGRTTRKICDASGDRRLPLPVGRAARRLQAKARGVAKLARARVHVEVKVADQLAARRVIHLRGCSHTQSRPVSEERDKYQERE